MCSDVFVWCSAVLSTQMANSLKMPANRKADARIRTADPFITSEVLYQLSYVGEWAILAGRRTRFLGVENARTRDSRAGGEITFFDPRGVQSGARRTDLATFL